MHRADHRSAACNAPATSAAGLQHDAFATPASDGDILRDATDEVGRCHDTAGGGLELIDISGSLTPSSSRARSTACASTATATR